MSERLLPGPFRKVHSMLHMGNGITSLGYCYQLVERLVKAFNTLSGLQQVPYVPTQVTNERAIVEDFQVSMDLAEIDDTIKDIAMALTGREWGPIVVKQENPSE